MSDEAFDQWYDGLDVSLGKPPAKDAVVRRIVAGAKARGIDPAIALKVAESEGLNAYIGDKGTSFGPFQLHYKNNIPGLSLGGLGDEFTKATGKHAKDPTTVFAQIDFALDHAVKNGWGAFHGAKKVGLGEWDGIGKGAARATIAEPQFTGKISTLDDLNENFRKDFEERPALKLEDEPVLVDKRLPSWGIVPEMAQGAFFQKAPQILGAMSAAKEVGRDVLQGGDFSNALQNAEKIYYPQAKAQWEEARDNWAQDHGGTQVTANVAGGIGPTMLGVGAFNNALRGAAAAVPMLRPIASFLGGTAGEGASGVSGFLTRRASDAAAGATQGLIGNTVTGQDPELGAEMGAPANVLLGPAVRKLSSPLRATARPEVARAAQNYLQQGGELPAASIIANPETQGFVRALAGNPDAEVVEGFTRQMADRVGATPIMEQSNVRGLTPEVMSELKDQLYSRFDDFAQRTNVIVDTQLMTDLFDANVDAAKNLGVARPEAAKAVQKAIQHIEDVAMNNISGGHFTISAKEFRQLTSSDGVIDKLFEADHNATPYAERIRDALYAALERTSPESAEEIRKLRRQYAEFLKLEKVAPSEETGLLNPKKVAAKYGKEDSDFGRTARMGHYLPATDPAGHVKMPAPSLLKNALRNVPYGLGGGLLGGGIVAAAGEQGLPWLPSMLNDPVAATLGAASVGLGLAGKSAFGDYLASRNYLQTVLENSLNPGAETLANPLLTAIPLASRRDKNWK